MELCQKRESLVEPRLDVVDRVDRQRVFAR